MSESAFKSDLIFDLSVSGVLGCGILFSVFSSTISFWIWSFSFPETESFSEITLSFFSWAISDSESDVSTGGLLGGGIILISTFSVFSLTISFSILSSSFSVAKSFSGITFSSFIWTFSDSESDVSMGGLLGGGITLISIFSPSLISFSVSDSDCLSDPLGLK